MSTGGHQRPLEGTCPHKDRSKGLASLDGEDHQTKLPLLTADVHPRLTHVSVLSSAEHAGSPETVAQGPKRFEVGEIELV